MSFRTARDSRLVGNNSRHWCEFWPSSRSTRSLPKSNGQIGSDESGCTKPKSELGFVHDGRSFSSRLGSIV